MWPLERVSRAEVLRVGRLAVERWLSVGSDWILTAREVLPPTAVGTPSSLGEAISALYADRPTAPVTIVVESAWLPVVVAGTGGELLSQRQAGELVRHRLGMLQGPGVQAVSGWDVRIDFKIGERFVLGFGCAPGVVERLRSSLEDLGIFAARLLPAFSWGWQIQPVREGWWLWQEQDRWIASFFAKGRVLGLNAALVPTTNAEQMERLVDVEALRLGLAPATRSINASAWSGVPSGGENPSRILWRSLSAVPSIGGARKPSSVALVESTS